MDDFRTLEPKVVFPRLADVTFTTLAMKEEDGGDKSILLGDGDVWRGSGFQDFVPFNQIEQR